jgi:hypothetical protein
MKNLSKPVLLKDLAFWTSCILIYFTFERISSYLRWPNSWNPSRKDWWWPCPMTMSLKCEDRCFICYCSTQHGATSWKANEELGEYLDASLTTPKIHHNGRRSWSIEARNRIDHHLLHQRYCNSVMIILTCGMTILYFFVCVWTSLLDVMNAC